MLSYFSYYSIQMDLNGHLYLKVVNSECWTWTLIHQHCMKVKHTHTHCLSVACISHNTRCRPNCVTCMCLVFVVVSPGASVPSTSAPLNSFSVPSCFVGSLHDCKRLLIFSWLQKKKKKTSSALNPCINSNFSYCHKKPEQQVLCTFSSFFYPAREYSI